MELKINPELQKHIWPLKTEEFEQLEKNILEEGVRCDKYGKIIAWGNTIIDGHHRYKIAQKHGLEFEVEPVEFEDIEEVKKWMDKIQAGRRNLNLDQFQISIGRIYNREKKKPHRPTGTNKGANFTPLKTAEKIAEETGVSPKSVKNYGKKAEEFESLKEEKPELYTSIYLGEKSFKDVKKEERKQKIEEKRKEVAERGRGKEIDIDFRLGDFEQVFADIKDGSVDCIITDPPYPKEYIEEWSKLSRFAKRVLKPNGFCIAYSGQLNLPEVINRMSENLDYYWMFSLFHTGNRQLINARNLFCGWKPILIFQNGFKKTETPFDDFIRGSGMEKDGHDWQQAELELIPIIEKFTVEGDLVCEPFAGSGTTIKACKKLNRSIIASEIDEQTYNIAKSEL